MKHLFKIQCIAILIFTQSASSQDILWENSYGGKHGDYLSDVIPTADYGFIIGGSSLSAKTGNKKQNNEGSLDYWIWKMDENGSEEWQKCFGGSGVDRLSTIRITRDGGFILGGTSNSKVSGQKTGESRGASDYWIIKLNAAGGEMWQKTIGGSDQEDLVSAIPTKDGGYIIGGTSYSDKSGDKSTNNSGGSDYWILKLNNLGEIEWQKTYGGDYNEKLSAIHQTADGGYIVGGSSNSTSSGEKLDDNFGDFDFWILKLDDEGNINWQKSIGGNRDDQLSEIRETRDGGFIIGGYSNSSSSNNKTTSSRDGTDLWIIKLNNHGVNEWQESLNFEQVDILTSIIENKDGSFLISGYSQGKDNSSVISSNKIGKGKNDYAAIKVNAIGEKQWVKFIGSDGDDILRKSIETRDGGYLLAGSTNGPASGDKNSGNGRNDFWVVKLKDRDKRKEIVQKIEAIPNPANNYSNVIVGYDFLNGSAAVYDISGRQIKNFKINSRTVPINLEGLPEGIYLVQITTNVSTDTVKIIKRVSQN